MQRKIRLLIIEAHKAVCRALEVRLRSSSEIEVVATLRNTGGGRSPLAVVRPDVVLLGLQGSHNGELRANVNVVSDLIEQGHKVMVLTSYADEVERELMLRAGVCRYLLKDINTDQLISEIKAVAAAAASQ